MIKFGSLELSSPILLAPLAGITDLPFRMLNRRFGCEFAFLEMVSAKSLTYQSRNTLKLLASCPEDRPLGIQLVGSEPDVFKRAMDILQAGEYSVFDLNAACPVPKVTGKGEGASLMNHPARLRELLKIMVQNTTLPVTVKIRSGWDEGSQNARDVALHAEDAGIHTIIIHGRTRKQGYSGGVDYRAIQEVCEAVSIPVIGSGDAFSPELVRKMMDETGCCGVAIARGSLGNPWIFRETAAYLKNGKKPERPGMEEIISTVKSHLDACIDFYGEEQGSMIFRKFFVWYTKGFRGVKRLREKTFHASSRIEMHNIISELSLAEADHRYQSADNVPESEMP